jgi:hypothetical protein
MLQDFLNDIKEHEEFQLKMGGLIKITLYGLSFTKTGFSQEHGFIYQTVGIKKIVVYTLDTMTEFIMQADIYLTIREIHCENHNWMIKI